MTDAISAICTTVGHSQLVDHEERRENVGICDDSAFSRETACSSDQVRNATVVNPSEAPIPATGTTLEAVQEDDKECEQSAAEADGCQEEKRGTDGDSGLEHRKANTLEDPTQTTNSMTGRLHGLADEVKSLEVASPVADSKSPSDTNAMSSSMPTRFDLYKEANPMILQPEEVKTYAGGYRYADLDWDDVPEDELDDHIDKSLEELSAAVARLRRISEQMAREIEDQNGRLNRIGGSGCCPGDQKAADRAGGHVPGSQQGTCCHDLIAKSAARLRRIE